jgi:tight adherence protein B
VAFGGGVVAVSATVSASVVIDHRLGIVVALLGVGAIAAVFTLVSGRADRRVVGSLPEVLHSIARVGRAGPGLREAVRAAADEASGPVAADLASVVRRLDGGSSLVDALGQWTVVRPLPEVRLAVAQLSLAAEVGAPFVGMADDVAGVLVDQAALEGEAVAQAAQARASVLVLAAAPLVLAALAAAADASTLEFLLHTTVGLICLGLAVGLDSVGLIWMHRLVEQAR